MTQQIRKYNYSEKTVTAIIADDSGSKYLWVAFAQDGTDCAIYKVGAFNALQKFYEFDHTVNSIVAMQIYGSIFYVALDGATNIGYFYSKTAPLTSSQAIPIPSGITEAPVDMIVTSSNLWFLTPGTSVGDKAKLIKMSLTGTFVETIDLNVSGKVVIDAISLAEDSATGDLYITTNTSPASLVRVYENSGGTYIYDVTSLS